MFPALHFRSPAWDHALGTHWVGSAESWARTVTAPYNRISAVHSDIERILFSEEQIVKGIDDVARRITQDFTGEEFTVVSILKGSCIFTADLIRRLPIPLNLAFVSVESYGKGTTPGELTLHMIPTREELRGQRVLLLDDILDSGRTLSKVRAALLEHGAKHVSSCVFLDKPSRRALEIEADYRCFEVEDLFVVGYGLDFAGRYRNLPYVGHLCPEVIEAEAQSTLDGEAAQ